MKLPLWAGVITAVVLAGVVIFGGLAIMTFIAVVQRRRDVGHRIGLSGERAFDRSYYGVISGARTLTGRVQSGSLPTYVLVAVPPAYAVGSLSFPSEV